MSLGELIKILEAENPEKVVPFGFHNPHSYRGYYDELGFEPTRNVTVASMLADCRGALGATFTGYKGGEFTMAEYTRCWLAMWGDTSDDTLGPALLRGMLAASTKPAIVGTPWTTPLKGDRCTRVDGKSREAVRVQYISMYTHDTTRDTPAEGFWPNLVWYRDQNGRENRSSVTASSWAAWCRAACRAGGTYTRAEASPEP